MASRPLNANEIQIEVMRQKVVALIDRHGRFPLDPPLDIAADLTIEVAEDQVIIRDGQGVEVDRRTWPIG